MSKFVRAGFLIFSLVFVSRDLELGGVLPLVRPEIFYQTYLLVLSIFTALCAVVKV